MSEGWLIFWATVGATAITQAIVAAFVYGKLTESVKGLRSSITDLWAAHRDTRGTLDNHEQRISRIEGRTR